jgi:hypothetical protein
MVVRYLSIRADGTVTNPAAKSNTLSLHLAHAQGGAYLVQANLGNSTKGDSIAQARRADCLASGSRTLGESLLLAPRLLVLVLQVVLDALEEGAQKGLQVLEHCVLGFRG